MNIIKRIDRLWNLGVASWLFLFCLFTISGDIFWVFDYGFTFRFFNILSLPFMAIGIVRALGAGRGSCLVFLLAVWALINLILIINAQLWVRPLGYSIWLFQLVALCYAFEGFFYDLRQIETYFVWFLRTAVAVSLFGMAQWLFAVAFGWAPLLSQSFFGGLPRINGFSYEPSYYASYLIPFWVALAECLYLRATFIRRTEAWVSFSIMGASLILSTSRIAYMMMGLYFVWMLVRVLRRPRLKTALGLLSVFLVAGAAAFAGYNFALSKGMVADDFLAGTGLAGTAAHSVDDRMLATDLTWQAFKDSPYFGKGLGGLSESVADQLGIQLTNLGEAKLYESGNITIGVLAAGGLVGSLPFFAFILILITRFFRTYGRFWGPPRILLQIIGAGLLFEFIVLQFNQNILRNYFWVWIGFMLAAFSVLARLSGGNVPADASRRDRRSRPQGLTNDKRIRN